MISTPTPDPTDPATPVADPGAVVPAAGGPLPVAVRAAADDAAKTIGDAWREARWSTRLRTLPETASEALELLLDRIVKAAVEEPYPVHDAGQVAARLETDGHPAPFGGAMFLALAGLLLLLPTPLTLVALIGAVFAVRQQVREEESYLLRVYGDEFRRYAARVGRFFPRGRKTKD